jgi:hypothetical protein
MRELVDSSEISKSYRRVKSSTYVCLPVNNSGYAVLSALLSPQPLGVGDGLHNANVMDQVDR